MEFDDKTSVIDASQVAGLSSDQAKRTACLIVLTGSQAGRMFKLQFDEMVIGRSVDASIRIGSQTRKVRTPYTEHFDAKMNRIVESVFRDDLSLLGYAFGKPHPTAVIEPTPALAAVA